MSGIGDNQAFKRGLEQRYEVVATLEFDDHLIYHMSDLARMLEFEERYPDAVIMTTEKDAVKLCNSAAIPDNLRCKMFYERISICLLPTPPAINNSRETLFERIDKDIKNKDNGSFIRGF
jgi:tetraacyldisaccharide 4'-kinase